MKRINKIMGLMGLIGLVYGFVKHDNYFILLSSFVLVCLSSIYFIEYYKYKQAISQKNTGKIEK